MGAKKRKKKMSSMFVKVTKFPGVAKDVAIEEGASVQRALDVAEISLSGNEQIQVNAQSATTSQTLRNGDTVVVAKGAKGNQ